MARRTTISSTFFSLLLAVTASAQDLNSNDVQDSRDLREGTSPDCNLNGVVDERDAGVPHFTQAIEHLNALEGEQFQNNVWDIRPIDFNQDGKLDLVVTSMFATNTGGITFWRNEGGAGLVYAFRLLIPNTRPYSLRVADFNGDGLDDFAASDASYNQAYVYLATGPETFAAPQTLIAPPANNGSTGLDVGDLDNDGDIDLAFSTWYLPKINTYINDGSGHFTHGATFVTGEEPRDVSIGDINGDGLADIAAANQFYYNIGAGTVSIHTNNGDGTFSLHTTLTMPDGVDPYNNKSEPQFVELVDVNADGFRDVVTSSNDSNVLTIHRNDGAGNFTLVQTLGGWWLESDAQDVLVTDLDGDGMPELVWGNVDMHEVGIYKSIDGQFELQQNFASSNYGGFILAATDVSGDGMPDIISSNNYSRSFGVMVNKGDLDFDATIQLRPSEFPAKALLADFTSDGITDLFAVRQPYISGTSYLAVYPGLIAGGADFSNEAVETELTLSDGVIVVRDVNADGQPDLLDVSGHCYVYLGNGDGSFAPAIISPVNPNGVRLVTGDIDGDSLMDLAWIVGGHPSKLRVSFGDGAGNFGPYTEYVDVKEDESIGIGDITGDGLPEIITGHRYGVVSVHPNNGDGTFGTRRDIIVSGPSIAPAFGAVAVADFDGDTDNDVIVSGFGLQMFINPGDGNLPEVPVTVASEGASELFPVDIDLDGTMDLYGESFSVAVYLNTAGDGIFGVVMKLRNYDSNARNIVVADANNDGRIDVMMHPENSWSNYLFLNLPSADVDLNGDEQLDSCFPFVPGDVNGDLVLDGADRAMFCDIIGSVEGEQSYVLAADFNVDGVIDHLDLNLLNGIQPVCGGDVVDGDTFLPPADGVTNGADLAFLLGAWGNQPSCADLVDSRTFQSPADGKVDGADLAYLLGAWGACQ